VGSKEGHKTIGKKLGKMWSKFRARGRSITLDAISPTAISPKGTSPTPQSIDVSDEEEEEEVNKKFKIFFSKITFICRAMWSMSFGTMIHSLALMLIEW